MNRRIVGLVLITLVTIAVIALSASAIDSTSIESGFGIEGSQAGEAANGDSNAESGGSSSTGGSTGSSGLISGEITDAEASESASTPDSVASLLILTAFLSIAAAGVALIFWSTNDGDTLTAIETATEPESRNDPSRSAYDSSGVDLVNEVYAAWWEMTQHLDVPSSHSRTPAEFAATAIDAGMPPEAVDELTELFTAIRYGDATVTLAREQQANAALHRLHIDATIDRGEIDS